MAALAPPPPSRRPVAASCRRHNPRPRLVLSEVGPHNCPQSSIRASFGTVPEAPCTSTSSPRRPTTSPRSCTPRGCANPDFAVPRSIWQVFVRLAAHVRSRKYSRSPRIRRPLFTSRPRVALARRCAFTMCTATRRQEEMPQAAHAAPAGGQVTVAIWATRISGLFSA